MRSSAFVIAAAAIVSIALAACGSTPSGTAPGSTSAEPSAVTSRVASAEPTPTPSAVASQAIEAPVDSVPIPSNAYARVVTDDLRVRSKPGVADGSKKLEPLLQRGVLLVVLDGPVQASGYDWYEVQPTYSFEDAISYPAGWVAAADKTGESWIQPEQQVCPDQPRTVGDLQSIFETDEMYWEITCFGEREISLTARLGALGEWCGLEDEWTWEPSWFGSCATEPFTLVPVDDYDEGVTFMPAIPPDIDTSMAVSPEAPIEDWPIVEVAGTFDHPLAQTCHSVANENASGEGGMGSDPPDPAQTILGCRRQFVVTSMHEVDG